MKLLYNPTTGTLCGTRAELEACDCEEPEEPECTEPSDAVANCRACGDLEVIVAGLADAACSCGVYNGVFAFLPPFGNCLTDPTFGCTGVTNPNGTDLSIRHNFCRWTAVIPQTTCGGFVFGGAFRLEALSLGGQRYDISLRVQYVDAFLVQQTLAFYRRQIVAPCTAWDFTLGLADRCSLPFEDACSLAAATFRIRNSPA